ncbi:MAG: alpha/beta hydrolase [Bacteroidales bacterium]
MKKKFIFLFTIILTSMLFITTQVPRLIVEPRHHIIRLFSHFKKKDNTIEEAIYKGEKFEIQTFDHLKLQGEIISPKVDCKGNIILLHGIRANRQGMMRQANKLVEMGYRCILLDLRGHGESEGKYCSFGFYEKKDISTLINSLETRNYTYNLGILGHSMGAAIAIQCMELDKRIEFGIIESAFSDLKTTTCDYIKSYLGFKIEYLYNYFIRRAEKIAHFHFEDVIPENSCKNIQQDVLVFHGKTDKKISIEYGQNNFKNMASKNKKLMEVPGANHTDVDIIDRERFYLEIQKFFDRRKELALKQS